MLTLRASYADKAYTDYSIFVYALSVYENME